MDLSSDLLDKYSKEQVIAYLDRLASGILKNYQNAIKLNQPHILFGSLGDVVQLRSVVHEMHKRDDEMAAVSGHSSD